MSDKFALPKPIRYDEMNFPAAEDSYVVTGAKLVCSKSPLSMNIVMQKKIIDTLSSTGAGGKIAGARSPVTLSALSRGAFTGFSIKALDCDREEDNFIGKFPDCSSSEECVFNNLDKLWDLGIAKDNTSAMDSYKKYLGFATINSYEYTPDDPDSLTCTSFETKTVSSINYPLNLGSTLLCYEGEGIISIVANGQQPILAEGEIKPDGTWGYKNPDDEKNGFILKEDPRNYFFNPDLTFDPSKYNDGTFVKEYKRNPDGTVELYSNGKPKVKSYFHTKQSSLNCGSYAFDFPFDPITGKDLYTQNSGIGFGYQPGDFSGGMTPDERSKSMKDDAESDEIMIRLVNADMKALGLQMVPEKTATETQKSAGYKIAFIVDPKARDYHWLRVDSNGTWSHKAGTLAATQNQYYPPYGPMTDPLTQSGGYNYGVGSSKILEDGTSYSDGYFYVVPAGIK